MQPRWVRWTVFVIVVVVALSLALSIVPAFGGSDEGPADRRAARTPQWPSLPTGTHADYQLGGPYPPATGVGIVVRDRTARPSGRYDICYVNAFQTQPGELAWWRRHHSALLLRRDGRLVHDPGWPDEVLLDTRTPRKRAALAGVLRTWTAGCARAGFDAVEPDNLDTFTRSRGLLRRADNLAVARAMAVNAHRQGLAIAQKNTVELTASEVRRAGFDFAVAEDCEVYRECHLYRRIHGARVIEVEYADSGRAVFRRACAAPRAGIWPIVLRDRDLRTPTQRGHVRAVC